MRDEGRGMRDKGRGIRDDGRRKMARGSPQPGSNLTGGASPIAGPGRRVITLSGRSVSPRVTTSFCACVGESKSKGQGGGFGYSVRVGSGSYQTEGIPECCAKVGPFLVAIRTPGCWESEAC
jgi:hypothetical protein